MGNLIRDALAEDVGKGDITSRALLSPWRRGKAAIIAKEKGIVCGLGLVRDVFLAVDRRLRVEILSKDGNEVRPDQVVCTAEGRSRSILEAERTALNFLQQFSGIATRTSRFVRKIEGSNARIFDTRKTTPLLRRAEKYAVRCGGGFNHRLGLYDKVLIKDNHIKSVGSLEKAVRLARKRNRGKRIEVEVHGIEEARRALTAEADILLLDNMKPAQVKQVMKLVNGRAETEASGNITMRNVLAYARAGVGRISIGAELTLGAPALDFSLKMM